MLQVPADGPAFTVDQPGDMLHVSQTKSKKMKLAEGNSDNSGSQVLADAAQGSSEHPAHFAKNRFPAAELAENTDPIQRDCSAKREVDPVGHVASDGMRLPSEIKREVVDVSDDGPEDRVEAMSRGVGGTLASSGSECIANHDVSCDSSEWWVKPVRRGTSYTAVRKVSSDSKCIGHRDVSKVTRLALSVCVKKDAGISDAPETAEYMTPGAQSETDDPEDLLQLPVHFQSDAGGLPLLPEQVQFGSTTAEVAGLRDPSTQHSSVESFEDGGDSAELGQIPLSKVKTEHGVDEDETEFGHRPVPLSEVKIEIDVAEDMLDQLLMKGDSKGLCCRHVVNSAEGSHRVLKIRTNSERPLMPFPIPGLKKSMETDGQPVSGSGKVSKNGQPMSGSGKTIRKMGNACLGLEKVWENW